MKYLFMLLLIAVPIMAADEGQQTPCELMVGNHAQGSQGVNSQADLETSLLLDQPSPRAVLNIGIKDLPEELQRLAKQRFDEINKKNPVSHWHAHQLIAKYCHQNEKRIIEQHKKKVNAKVPKILPVLMASQRQGLNDQARLPRMRNRDFPGDAKTEDSADNKRSTLAEAEKLWHESEPCVVS